MSSDNGRRKSYLFPVDPEQMDVYITKKWYETTYVSYTEEDNTVSWFASRIGDKIFLEVNDDPDYFTNNNREPKIMTWKSVLDEFRALNYNGTTMYVYGCDNYVPSNIYAANGNHIYPNETTMITVLLDPHKYAKHDLDCKTINIDGQVCAIIGSNHNEVVDMFSPKDNYTMFGALPLGVLSNKYRYGINNETIYDMLMASSTSKSVITSLSDEAKEELFGEENV